MGNQDSNDGRNQEEWMKCVTCLDFCLIETCDFVSSILMIMFSKVVIILISMRIFNVWIYLNSFHDFEFNLFWKLISLLQLYIIKVNKFYVISIKNWL